MYHKFNFLVQQEEYLSVSHLFLQLSEFIEMQTQNKFFFETAYIKYFSYNCTVSLTDPYGGVQ